MHLDTWAVTIHPLAEVNFDHQIIVHPQGLTQRVLCNLQAPIQITSQHGSEIERDRERQVMTLEERHINAWVLVYPTLHLLSNECFELPPSSRQHATPLHGGVLMVDTRRERQNQPEFSGRSWLAHTLLHVLKPSFGT